jgi:choline dehydrogenase-like flavoprotein
MPTSGGVNPSLTIAANALRVADYIEDQFEAIKSENEGMLHEQNQSLFPGLWEDCPVA